MTQDQYDARYVFANGHDNYPPNHGAVRGTKVQYDDLSAFVRDYGGQFDRVGYPGGDFLGLKVDGVPAPWEDRALPVNSLAKPYHSYDLTGAALPPGWHVEVSEIAPAFGREGGGIQVLFIDSKGLIGIERVGGV